MSKLLYAWEFGAGLGHIGAFLPLARALRQRGHDVHWAVSQTGPAERLLALEGFTWTQAPICQETPRAGAPLSYNDILLRFGYANEEDLLGLVVAWRELLRLNGAQAVLADHAPTAILAARTLGIPVVLFSSAFCVPPRQRPLPNMRPWTVLAPGQLDALEHETLASINAVLERFAQPPFDAVAQLFDVAEDTLLGFPELDHYAERGQARYWGNLPDAGVGDAPAWPALPGKRIFGYLRAGTAHHESALAALHALGQPTVVFFPDAPPALAERYAAPHLVFSAKPLDLAQTADQADAAITYASLSTTTRFLLLGKPLVLLPGHLEQFLLARRVEEMGAGLLVNPEQPPLDLKLKLHRILFESDFALNAQAFARKYANFPQDTVIAHLIRRIEEIAAVRAPDGGSQERRFSPMRAIQIVNVRPEGFVFAESWREAIEAVHHGFAELGIDVPVRENYFGPNATPIVFGAHHLSAGEESKLPADAILYNFEQLKEGYPWFQPRYLSLLRRFRVWDYSIRNIAYLHRSNTSPRARHVPVGYVPQLSRIESMAQDIDVLFFGKLTDRRRRVLDALADRGLAVHLLVGVFGQERDRWIARSKVVLNIHASTGGLFEHLRVLYLLANRKAVVTEPGEADELDPELMLGLEVVPYDRLIESCVKLVGNPDARQTLANAGYKIITGPSRRMSTTLGMLSEFRSRVAGGSN